MHGIREFVIIASKRSLLESIILQPPTAEALQPSPMHIIKACLPHALQHLKHLSILNAMLKMNKFLALLEKSDTINVRCCENFDEFPQKGEDDGK